MSKPAKGRGRPRKRSPKPGERVALGLRVTPEVKIALDRAAAKSGRSQSQEAELRIERSFLDERLLINALELKFGRELAGILLLLGEAMSVTGRQAGFAKTFAIEKSERWFDNAFAFRQIIEAVNTVLKSLAPEGDSSAPKIGNPPSIGVDLDSVFENFGALNAAHLLREIADDEPQTTTAIERAPLLRSLLGQELVQRIKQQARGRQ